MGWFTKKRTTEEACQIQLLGKDVAYTLKRSSGRKTVGLRIDAKGLTVSAPPRVSQRWLNDYLLQKSGWVVQKLDEFQLQQVPSMAWHHGEILPYLGGDLRLRLLPVRGRNKVTLEGDALWIWLAETDKADKIEAAVIKWYRQQAFNYLNERVALYAQNLGVPHPKLSLSSAKTRWGSCNARGEIRLNWRLMKAPQEQIDYVVAHELAHLIELNHSPAFWQTVARIFPDYMRVRQDLRLSSQLYGLF